MEIKISDALSLGVDSVGEFPFELRYSDQYPDEGTRFTVKEAKALASELLVAVSRTAEEG